MSEAPVGVGVIGAGNISTQYLSSLTRFPDLSVRFVADLDVQRARAQATAFNVPGFGTVDELLARDDIEIVVNLTIPAAHVDVACRAVSAGKHVWTEKPFSIDRASGLRLLAEARRAGRRVATAPDTFLGPGVQMALRLIEDGAIGTPLTALALLQYAGPDTWHPDPAFLFERGAGPLFDFGPYYLTALVQVFGAVASVQATASTARRVRTVETGDKAGQTFRVEVPTHVAALLRFAGGGSAQGVWSFDSAMRRTGVLEVSGTEGTLVFPDPNRYAGRVELFRRGAAEPEVHQVVAEDGRGLGVLDLARAIRAGAPERASGELAFHVVDTLTAMAEAADTGAAVTVESTVDRAELLPGGWDPFRTTRTHSMEGTP